jgi:tripartite-type tricarboxylate transporter receptor subunit TctC
MAEDPTVVSGDIETPSQTEPSTTESETGGTEQPEPQTAQERIDWRKKQREDAELNAHVQSEIARARTRWQRLIRCTSGSTASTRD